MFIIPLLILTNIVCCNVKSVVKKRNCLCFINIFNESFELCNLVKNVKRNMQNQNYIEYEQGKEIMIDIILMIREGYMLFGVEWIVDVIIKMIIVIVGIEPSEGRLFEKTLNNLKKICLNLMFHTIKKIDDIILK